MILNLLLEAQSYPVFQMEAKIIFDLSGTDYNRSVQYFITVEFCAIFKCSTLLRNYTHVVVAII